MVEKEHSQNEFLSAYSQTIDSWIVRVGSFIAPSSSNHVQKDLEIAKALGDSLKTGEEIFFLPVKFKKGKKEKSIAFKAKEVGDHCLAVYPLKEEEDFKKSNLALIKRDATGFVVANNNAPSIVLCLPKGADFDSWFATFGPMMVYSHSGPEKLYQAGAGLHHIHEVVHRYTQVNFPRAYYGVLDKVSMWDETLAEFTALHVLYTKVMDTQHYWNRFIPGLVGGKSSPVNYRLRLLAGLELLYQGKALEDSFKPAGFSQLNAAEFSENKYPSFFLLGFVFDELLYGLELNPKLNRALSEINLKPETTIKILQEAVEKSARYRQERSKEFFREKNDPYWGTFESSLIRTIRDTEFYVSQGLLPQLVLNDRELLNDWFLKRIITNVVAYNDSREAIWQNLQRAGIIAPIFEKYWLRKGKQLARRTIRQAETLKEESGTKSGDVYLTNPNNMDGLYAMLAKEIRLSFITK